jgi:uncharacterized membrane protein YidH (DUF202 family)
MSGRGIESAFKEVSLVIGMKIAAAIVMIFFAIYGVMNVNRTIRARRQVRHFMRPIVVVVVAIALIIRLIGWLMGR